MVPVDSFHLFMHAGNWTLGCTFKRMCTLWPHHSILLTLVVQMWLQARKASCSTCKLDARNQAACLKALQCLGCHLQSRASNCRPSRSLNCSCQSASIAWCLPSIQCSLSECMGWLVPFYHTVQLSACMRLIGAFPAHSAACQNAQVAWCLSTIQSMHKLLGAFRPYSAAVSMHEVDWCLPSIQCSLSECMNFSAPYHKPL